MALPQTISGIQANPGRQGVWGPFLSSGGDTYFIHPDYTSGIIRAKKAADPSSGSFSDADTITETGDEIHALGCYQDGDTIHVAYYRNDADGGMTASDVVRYVTFSMSTDTFGTPETAYTLGVSLIGIVHASIGVRSDGDIVIAHTREQDRIMGSDYNRVVFSVKSGGGWSAFELDGSGIQESVGDIICGLAPGTSDRFHCIGQGDYDADSTNERFVATINGSDSVSRVDITASTSLTGSAGVFANSLVHLLAVYTISGDASEFSFTSADTPSAPSRADIQSGVGGQVAMALVADGPDLYVLYRDPSDSDLYIEQRGASAWDGTPENLATATVPSNRPVSAGLLDRAGGKAIGFIFYDGTNWTYDEYSLGAGAQTLSGVGAIASAEAFGSHTMAPGQVNVSPTAIASAEAFGSPDIFVSLSPTGIASAEAFGAPTLALGQVSVSPSGIASTAAFGTHALAPGQVVVTPTGITSAEAFGTASIAAVTSLSPSAIASAEAFGAPRLQLYVLPSGIASGEALGAVVVAPGQAAVVPTGIPSAEAFGSPTLVPGAVTLILTGISSAEAFGSHTISPGAVVVIPTGIASAEVFGGHTVKAITTLIPTGIASAEAFGSHALIPGAVTLIPTGIAPGEAFGSATLVPGAVTVTPTGIASAEVFGSALLQAITTLSPTGIASAEVFGTAQLNLLLRLTGIASAEAFGTAVVTAGLQLFPTGIASAEGFGAHALAPGAVALSPTGIASAEAFGTHAVSGAAVLVPTGIGSAEAFGAHAVVPGVVALVPTGIASAEAFGTAALLPGVAAVLPPGIASGEAFGTLRLTLYLLPPAIASAEAFGAPTLAPGQVLLSPSGIASAEAFGAPTLQGGVFVFPGDGFAVDAEGRVFAVAPDGRLFAVDAEGRVFAVH